MNRKWKCFALICVVALAAIGVFVCSVKTECHKWLSAVNPISILIGGAFACWKYADSVEMRRREVLRRLLNDFHDQGHDATFYELVEHEGVDEWYCGKLSFLSTDYERRVDAMLRFFEDILNMYKMSVLVTEREFKYFEYYLDKISEDSSFCKYLSDLDEFCKEIANPLKYVTEYVKPRKKQIMTAVESKGHKDVPGVYAEDALIAYFKGRDGCITRSAQSIISRMRTIAKAVGHSEIAEQDDKKFCEKALEYINAYPMPKVAASLRSALRHWYRAKIKAEPTF